MAVVTRNHQQKSAHYLTKLRKFIWFWVAALVFYNVASLLITQHTAIAGQQQLSGWADRHWLSDFVIRRDLPERESEAMRNHNAQGWDEDTDLEIGEQQHEEGNEVESQPLQRAEQSRNETKQNPKHHHFDLQLPTEFQQGMKMPMLFVTVGSNATLNFLLNWNKALELLNLDRLVVVLDTDTMQACEAHHIAHMYMPPASGVLGAPKSYSEHYQRIRQVKAFMIAVAKELLLKDTAEVVVMTDTDIVWQRNPVDYVQQHPAVDWFQHTDCLSAEVEELWDHFKGSNARCGHAPGQAWGRAFNSGLIMIRNSTASIDLLQAWEDALNIGPLNNTSGCIIDDQLALNNLLDIDMGAIQAVDSSPRTIWAYKNTVKMHPLPVLLFSSGHVGFVQRLWKKHGVVPYMVHATFQRHGAQGKVARFNEFGMWHLNPPEYYTEGKFLSYNNTVLEFLESYATYYKGKYGVEMADLHKHMFGMQYQFATLRDALALARVTDRVVVLPTFYCYCDLDQSLHVIFECKIPGSDLQLPFKCPSDYLINFVLWEQHKVDHRPENFLDDKRVPNEIKSSVGNVFFKDSDIERKPYTVSSRDTRIIDLKYDAETYEGAKEGVIKQALAPFNTVRVLQFPNLHPGTFGGFNSNEANSNFDKWFTKVCGYIHWCCGGVIDSIQTELVVAYPKSLTAPWATWSPVEVERRKGCELAQGDKIMISKQRNHPCNFTLDYLHGEL